MKTINPCKNKVLYLIKTLAMFSIGKDNLEAILGS